MMTRSLSSPNSVVRSQVAPSASKMWPSAPEPGDGALDRTGLVQRVLVREDVEVDAEVVQARLDLAEHQVHAELAEDLLRLVARQVAERGRAAGIVGLDPRRDLEDVAAAVAVLGRRLAQVRGDEAAGEAVDLDAVVVEVVLARDVAALGLEDAREAVADGGPAGAADVQGAGRVRGHELDVDASRRRRARRNRRRRPARRSPGPARPRPRHPAGC